MNSEENFIIKHQSNLYDDDIKIKEKWKWNNDFEHQQLECVTDDKINEAEYMDIDIENIKKEPDLIETREMHPVHENFIRESENNRFFQMNKENTIFNRLQKNDSFYSKAGSFYMSDLNKIDNIEIKTEYNTENEQNNQCNLNLIKEEVFRCNACNKEFLSLFRLLVHKYKFCEVRLTATNLMKRLLKPHFKRKHKCKMCNRSYLNRSYLKIHLYMHISKRQFSCEICSKNFYTNSHLKNHIKTHNVRNIIKNNIYKKNFNLNSEINNNKCSRENKSFQCEICRKNFQTETALITHKKSHSRKRFYCNLCDKNFKYKSIFEVPQRNHSEDRPFQCKKNFKTDIKLTTHIGKCQLEHKPYQCKVCQKNFKTKSKLEKHEKCHPKPFKCTIYKENFNTKLKLVLHQRSHPILKIFQCNLCSKTFKNILELEKHMILHSQDKSFQCNFYNSSFKSKLQLNSHQICHFSPTKKFYHQECCQTNSKSRVTSETSTESHSVTKNFRCPFFNCKKNFRIQKKFTMHLKTHSFEKSFQCKICMKNFCGMPGG